MRMKIYIGQNISLYTVLNPPNNPAGQRPIWAHWWWWWWCVDEILVITRPRSDDDNDCVFSLGLVMTMMMLLTSTILLSTISERECHIPRLCSVTCSSCHLYPCNHECDHCDHDCDPRNHDCDHCDHDCHHGNQKLWFIIFTHRSALFWKPSKT